MRVARETRFWFMSFPIFKMRNCRSAVMRDVNRATTQSGAVFAESLFRQVSENGGLAELTEWGVVAA